MKDKKLSKRDKETLLKQIQEIMETGPKSIDETRDTITDRSGDIYNLGERKSGVFVDDNHIPRNLTENKGMTLDCGHVVTSLEDGIQKCDFGHVVCSKHELIRCSKCKKLMCEIDVEWEDDLPVCPDHKQSWITPTVVIFVILSILYLLAR